MVSHQNLTFRLSDKFFYAVINFSVLVTFFVRFILILSNNIS